MLIATVIGSGPNGLSAAIVLAAAGLDTTNPALWVLCILVASLTLFVVKSGYFSTAWNHVRDIRAQDRLFLDDLMQKHNQHAVLDSDPMVAMQTIRKTSMIGPGNDPAPKAELVVNSAIVKRAEPVVHSGTVKRPGLVRRRH